MQTEKWLWGAVLSATLVAGPCLATSDPSIAAGDARGQVVASLGEAGGHLRIGRREIMLYDRGRIELEDGIVTDVDLVSADEAARRTAQRSRQRKEMLARHDARRAARRAEGERILEGKLSVEAFLALSARDRVDYWSSFIKRYPDVDASVPYKSALADYQEERLQRNRQRKLAELEERTEVAERRALMAERRVASANCYPHITYNQPAWVVRGAARQCQPLATGLPRYRHPAIHRHPKVTFVIDTAPTRYDPHVRIRTLNACRCRVACGRAGCRRQFSLCSQGAGSGSSVGGLSAGLSYQWR